MRRPLRTLAATLLLATASCGESVEPPEPTASAIPPDSFRAALVDLAVARIEALPDTQAWRARRAEVLRRHGLTERDLGDFVEAWGHHDEVMEGIYRSLGAALDSLAEERAPGDTAGP